MRDLAAQPHVFYPLFVHVGLLGALTLLHVATLRHHLISERRIFVFHVAIFVVLPLFTLGLTSVLGWSVTLYGQLALYGLSAIYALSFLELWSLTQGGYSLQILMAIKDGTSRNLLRDALAIGQEKLSGRLGSIVQLGLAQHRNGVFQIKPRGRIVCLVTSLLAGISGVRLKE